MTRSASTAVCHVRTVLTEEFVTNTGTAVTVLTDGRELFVMKVSFYSNIIGCFSVLLFCMSLKGHDLFLSVCLLSSVSGGLVRRELLVELQV